MLRNKSRRYHILLIVELICVLLLLPGCFRKDQLMDSILGEDIAALTTWVENYQEFSGDKISLTPGVYRIQVQTTLQQDQSIYVEMKYDNSYFHAFHGNGVSIFPGDHYMEFNVYVLDRVPAAYVQCDFYNVGTEALVKLDVYRTNRGNWVLLFLTLAIFSVLDFLIEFRRRILAGKISKEQQVVFWTLAAGVLLAYFPFLTDYFWMGADTTFHLTRIAGLTDTLRQGGSLPVRVQSGWLYDHGYAVALFYGDLFLFIPVFLLQIGFSFMTSYKLFILFILVATVVIAYHSFYRCMKDRYAALLGSMVYLLMPYHLFNVYNRGAVGESLAMIFLPLVCCGIYLLYTESVTSASYKKNKWYIVWGISGVIQSHVLSTEMTVVFMALVCAVFWKKTLRKETFLQLLEASGIVLVVNMWFWLPLVYMMNADVYYLQSITRTQIQDKGIFLAAILQMLPNKGSTHLGLQDREPIQVGAGALMLLLVYVFWNVRTKKGNSLCNILVGFSFLAIFMSTRYLPWDAVGNLPGIGPIASSLQFPWRWLVMAAVLISLFAGFFFLRVKECGGNRVKAALGVFMVIFVSLAVYHVNSIAYGAGAIYLYTAENMGTINVGNAEYVPDGVPIYQMYYHDPVAEDGLTWSHYEKRGTNVKLTLENSTTETRYLEVPLIGYKGYAVAGLGSSGGQAEPYITEETGTHGDLRIAVPAQYHGNVVISYEGHPLFHVAEVVSLMSLIAIISAHFLGKRKRLRNGNEYGANK
ncbi:MAG: hypothetical protein J1E64_05755 [Acetatifactor sp.]|nr:hypothetical protein [Acetatifactor sp.]